MHRIPTVLLAALLVAACGGKSGSTAATTPPPAHDHHAEHHHGEGEEHAHGAPGTPVARFHDVLAPLWHAPEGAQRVTDTCARAGDLHGLAQGIVDAGAPAGAAADYLDGAKILVEACAALHAECETPARAEFVARFAGVHDAFHAVAERAPK
jgi:hypothetical protein